MNNFRKIIYASILFFITHAANAEAIRNLGNIGQILIPATAGVITLVKQDKTGLLQFSAAFGTTLGAVYILKPLVKRRRPDGDAWSFPSGHTASAFAGAAYLQRRYGWNYGAPAYAAAWFVGLSRVYAKRHWPTDVLAGAAIGIVTNFIFTRRYHAIQISPLLGRNLIGAKFAMSW